MALAFFAPYGLHARQIETINSQTTLNHNTNCHNACMFSLIQRLAVDFFLLQARRMIHPQHVTTKFHIKIQWLIQSHFKKCGVSCHQLENESHPAPCQRRIPANHQLLCQPPTLFHCLPAPQFHHLHHH